MHEDLTIQKEYSGVRRRVFPVSIYPLMLSEQPGRVNAGML